MPHWLYLALTVPAVSALIGWFTNWQAVKMIFWPERRVGWGPLAWQGIVFHHADKFATNLGRLARANLFSGADVLAQVELSTVQALAAGPLAERAPALVARAAELVSPGAWQSVPAPVQAMVTAQVVARSKALVGEAATALAPVLAEEIDIEAVVHGQLTGPHVRRLARLTQEIGHREFRFIEWSGAVFGWIIGMGQLAVWSAMQTWWVMPVFGIGVGLITNWLALQMIFRPHERTRYLGIPYQGLFPKRQAEISRDYGRSTATEVITPGTLIDHLLLSPRRERLLARLETTLEALVAREWAAVRGLVPVQVDDEQLHALRRLLVTEVLAVAAALRPQIEQALAERLQVQTTVESRLASLSKPEFERMLRGVFQEDELTLIVVGGVLGGAVGCLQALLVLAQ